MLAAWHHSVSSKNRDRLLEGDIATRFLAAVLDQPRVKKPAIHRAPHGRRDAIEARASLKILSHGMARMTLRPVAAAMPKPTSMARSGRTRRNVPPRIPMTAHRKDRARKPSFAFIGHGLWRTAMAFWLIRV